MKATRPAVVTAWAALLLAALTLWPRRAAAEVPGWLRERVDAEWVVGAGGWRTAIAGDVHVPGFDALAGGGELVLGADVGAGLAVVTTGRALVGQVSGAGTYLEVTGGAAVQLRLGRARLRAGPAAGFVRWRETATLVGGFVAASIDLFSLGGGRLSTTISMRLDIDDDIGAREMLPDASVALALGLGLRY